MVVTTPDRIQTYGKSVYDTWAKRCDIFYFISSKAIDNVPVILVDVEEKWDSAWQKYRWKFAERNESSGIFHKNNHKA